MPRPLSEEEKEARLAAILDGIRQDPPLSDKEISERHPDLFSGPNAVLMERRRNGIETGPRRGPQSGTEEALPPRADPVQPAVPGDSPRRRGPYTPRQ